MAAKHRRHSSVDSLGWMYTNRTIDAPLPPQPPNLLGRSISTRVSSFSREFFRQSSTVSQHFNPGEYFTGCFQGPRSSVKPESVSTRQLLELDSAGSSGGSWFHGGTERPGQPRRQKSLSTSILSSFGSMNSCAGANWNLEMRAAELNRKAATDKNRVRQGGQWELEGDMYMKPPAWKQFIRKLRAQAKRHVHPAPVLTNYDAESYEKNFDDGRIAFGLPFRIEEDDELELELELGVRERALHNRLLTKLHSQRFDPERTTGLMKSISVPVPPTKGLKAKEEVIPIWQRRSRPPLKLELTKSL